LFSYCEIFKGDILYNVQTNVFGCLLKSYTIYCGMSDEASGFTVFIILC